MICPYNQRERCIPICTILSYFSSCFLLFHPFFYIIFKSKLNQIEKLTVQKHFSVRKEEDCLGKWIEINEQNKQRQKKNY